MRDPDWNQLGHLKQSRAVDQHKLPEGESLVRGYKTCVSGAILHVTDKTEARPQSPLLIPQARTRMKELGLVIMTCYFLSSVELTEKHVKVLFDLDRSMRRHKAFCSCAQRIIHKVNH